jgi:hypothetical protein
MAGIAASRAPTIAHDRRHQRLVEGDSERFFKLMVGLAATLRPASCSGPSDSAFHEAGTAEPGTRDFLGSIPSVQLAPPLVCLYQAKGKEGVPTRVFLHLEWWMEAER